MFSKHRRSLFVEYDPIAISSKHNQIIFFNTVLLFTPRQNVFYIISKVSEQPLRMARRSTAEDVEESLTWCEQEDVEDGVDCGRESLKNEDN